MIRRLAISAHAMVTTAIVGSLIVLTAADADAARGSRRRRNDDDNQANPVIQNPDAGHYDINDEVAADQVPPPLDIAQFLTNLGLQIRNVVEDEDEGDFCAYLTASIESDPDRRAVIPYGSVADKIVLAPAANIVLGIAREGDRFHQEGATWSATDDGNADVLAEDVEGLNNLQATALRFQVENRIVGYGNLGDLSNLAQAMRSLDAFVDEMFPDDVESECRFYSELLADNTDQFANDLAQALVTYRIDHPDVDPRHLLFDAASVAHAAAPGELAIDQIDPNEFDWSQEEVTIRSPEGGTRGVFIVGNGLTEVVVKFENDAPMRPILADRVLESAGLRTPQTTALTNVDDQFTTIKNRIQQIVEDLPAVPGYDRVRQVFGNTFQDVTTILLQKPIEGVAESESVDAVVSCFKDDRVRNRPTPRALVELVNNTEISRSLNRADAFLNAMTDQSLARQLGRLAVADAFLGNQDRMQLGGLNLGNLMLDDQGFCTIDNFADAPSPRAFAWEKFPETLDGAVRLERDRQLDMNPDQPYTIEGESTITRSEWFDAILRGYVNANSQDTASLDRAMNLSAEARVISEAFQSAVSDMIDDAATVNAALLLANDRVFHEVDDDAGDDQPMRLKTQSLRVVTEISDGEDEGTVRLSTRQYDINWENFEKSLVAGMKLARRKLLDDANMIVGNTTFEESTFFRDVYEASVQSDDHGELSAETLELRMKFMMLRAKGFGYGLAKSLLLQDPDGQVSTLPGQTWTFYHGFPLTVSREEP